MQKKKKKKKKRLYSFGLFVGSEKKKREERERRTRRRREKPPFMTKIPNPNDREFIYIDFLYLCRILQQIVNKLRIPLNFCRPSARTEEEEGRRS